MEKYAILAFFFCLKYVIVQFVRYVKGLKKNNYLTLFSKYREFCIMVSYEVIYINKLT